MKTHQQQCAEHSPVNVHCTNKTLIFIFPQLNLLHVELYFGSDSEVNYTIYNNRRVGTAYCAESLSNITNEAVIKHLALERIYTHIREARMKLCLAASRSACATVQMLVDCRCDSVFLAIFAE